MNKFTRQQFYELIWTKSLAEIVRIYDISMKEIKLICAKKLIPVPNSMNWTSTINTLSPLPEYLLDNDPIILEPRLPDEKLNESKSAAKPQKNHHKLVQKARETLIRNSKEYKHRDILSASSDELRIRASRNMIERACNAISNFLFKVEAQGYSIEVYNHEYCVNIDGVHFPFYLREKQSYSYGRTKYGYERRIETPSGILILNIGQWRGRDWAESKSTPLEEKYDKIIASLVLEAKKEIKYEEERKQRDKLRAFLKHVKKVKEKYRKDELEDFKDLMRYASRWHQANIIRGFLTDLRQQLLSQNNATPNKLNWIRWAEEKADWFDPTLKVKDKYLKKRDIEAENLDMFRSDKVENKTYHYSSEYFYRR